MHAMRETQGLPQIGHRLLKNLEAKAVSRVFSLAFPQVVNVWVTHAWQ